MHNTIDTVRRLIGRRRKITRQEMADIIMVLDFDIVASSSITGRMINSGELVINGQIVADPGCEREATALAWANMCTDIMTVSVVGDSIRYDQPGSMHPLQHAEVLFAAEELEGYEYDQIGQLRGRADRVLVVSGDPLMNAAVMFKMRI